MSIQKLQFVDPVKDDFLCCICREPWTPDEASQCATCQGVLCRSCFNENTAKGTACLKCKVDPATFGPIHRLVRGLAESLQVRCYQSGFGCTWTGQRSNLRAHDAECSFKPKPLTYVKEDAVPSDLMCPVCHAPMIKPVQLPCEHVFCTECIVEAMRRAPECPVDRTPCSEGSLSDVPKVIHEMLDDIPVYCVNRGLTTAPCKWEGRRRDYDGHRVVCTAAAATITPTTAAPVPTAAAAPGKMALTTQNQVPSFVPTDLEQDLFVMAHFKAPELASLEQRKKPLSLSAVIDVSGSMSGSKMEMARQALVFMVEELTNRDEFGIVTFSSDVNQALPLTKMDDSGKQMALNVIRNIKAGGSTNLSGGLLAGISQVKREPFAASTAEQPDDLVSNSKACKRRPTSSGTTLMQRIASTLSGSPAAATPIPADATLTATAWSATMKRDKTLIHKFGVSIKLSAAAARCVESVHVGPTRDGRQLVALDGTECILEGTQRSELKLFIKTTAVYGAQTIERVVPLKEDDLNTTELTLGVPSATAVPPASTAVAHCRAVLLFTDGQANIGLTTAAQFVDPMRTALSGNEDIVVHTFGFGADHNASLLQSIAENASGTYYFIKDVAAMKESFADCLGGLLSTVAQNVKLTFVPKAPFYVKKTLTSYTTAGGEDSITVTMRDLYSSEGRDVVVQLKLRTAASTTAIGSAVPLGTFTVTYDSLLSGATETVQAVATAVAATEKYTGAPNAEVTEQCIRVEAVEEMKLAREQADRGDVEGARGRLRCMKAKAMAAPQTSLMEQLDDDLDEVDGLMTSEAAWASRGSKATAQYGAGYAQQRLNRAPAEMTEGLAQMDNSWKCAMRKKAK